MRRRRAAWRSALPRLLGAGNITPRYGKLGVRIEGEDRAADVLVGEAAQIDAAQTGGVGIDGVLRDRTEAAAPTHRRFDDDDVLSDRVDADRFQLLLITRHRLV